MQLQTTLNRDRGGCRRRNGERDGERTGGRVGGGAERIVSTLHLTNANAYRRWSAGTDSFFLVAVLPFTSSVPPREEIGCSHVLHISAPGNTRASCRHRAYRTFVSRRSRCPMRRVLPLFRYATYVSRLNVCVCVCSARARMQRNNNATPWTCAARSHVADCTVQTVHSELET